MSESATDATVNVYVEVKPLLNSAQVTVSFPRTLVTNRKSKISVKTRRTGIEIRAQNQTCEFNLKGVTFRPESCSGLQWQAGREIYFRMKCHDTDKEVITQEKVKIDSANSLLQKAFEVPNFGFFCRSCGLDLVSNISFRRVLPLPSEGWADFAENWFCHKHEEDSTNQYSLNPSLQDCFVGDLYFVIHKSHLKGNCLTTSEGSVICRRCRQFLGQSYRIEKLSTPDGVQIYQSFVRLGKSQTENVEPLDSVSTNLSHTVEQDLFGFLRHQATVYRGYRFIIECRRESKPEAHMLLWILDSNTLVYESSSLLSSTSVNIVPDKILRILYLNCLQSKDNSTLQEWQKNVSIHSLELPKQMCQILFEILLRSTTTLPLSLRRANGMMVGHLKMISEDSQ